MRFSWSLDAPPPALSHKLLQSRNRDVRLQSLLEGSGTRWPLGNGCHPGQRMKRPLPSQTWEEEGPGVPEQPCTGAAWCARGGWRHKGGFLRRGQGPRPPHSSSSLATRGHCLSFQEGGTARSLWDSGWSPHHGHGVPTCCWAAGQGTTGQQRPLGPARTAGASHTSDHSGQKKQTNRFAPSSADPKAEDQKTKAQGSPCTAPTPGRGPAPPAAEMSGNRRGTGPPSGH